MKIASHNRVGALRKATWIVNDLDINRGEIGGGDLENPKPIWLFQGVVRLPRCYNDNRTGCRQNKHYIQK